MREADPKAGGICWKLIGQWLRPSCLLVSVLLAEAYGLLAGYQIQSLRQARSGWSGTELARAR